MNKKILAITGSLALVGALGVGIYQSDASQAESRLDYEGVKELLATDYPGTITEFELEKEGNRAVYEIEIENRDNEYDLIVDAHTGEVLVSEEKFDDSYPSINEKNPSEQPKESKNESFISEEKAIEIALAEFSGHVEEVEFEHDDGRYKYEIEIEAGNQEADFEIDAKTGKILKMEIDD